MVHSSVVNPAPLFVCMDWICRDFYTKFTERALANCGNTAEVINDIHKVSKVNVWEARMYEFRKMYMNTGR